MNLLCSSIAKVIFLLNKVEYSSITIKGKIYVHVQKGGKCIIGKNFSSNNGLFSIDSSPYSKIIVYDKGYLSIGSNTGISSTCITCKEKIEIGNNVKIGTGCLIMDTDHHSTNPIIRNSDLDWENANSKPIKIGDSVFIGARSIICKGVIIGENSIVAVGSVVTKSIPQNEVWGGNPAKYIKKFK